MCVIIIRQAGKPMPSGAELKRAYSMNSHGCGFVSKSMKFKSLSFSNFLKRLHEVPQNENCIIHFRYATNGSVCRQNCHPFTKKGISFAHNGILSIMPDGDRTDSETAFRNIIYPCVQQYGFDSDELRLAVERIIGYSKFAMMNASGEIRLFGDFKAHDGRLYSNLRHLGRYI